MDERLGGKNHKLTLFNRSSVQMTGIVDVISFDKLPAMSSALPMLPL